MRKKLTSFSLLLALILSVSVAHAQFKKQLDRPSDLSGNIIKKESTEPGTFSNLFNMKMSQSYSMTFSSFGGQFQNLNAYTNSMRFFFTDRLTGQLDLSLLHSPFGNSYLNNNKNGFGAQVVISNAELDYQLSDKSSIHLQFQERPAYGYGLNPWGSAFNDMNSPFYYRNY